MFVQRWGGGRCDPALALRAGISRILANVKLQKGEDAQSPTARHPLPSLHSAPLRAWGRRVGMSDEIECRLSPDIARDIVTLKNYY